MCVDAIQGTPPSSVAPPSRTVFVVAPAYNEYDSIAAFISEVKLIYAAGLAPNGYRCELIIVDDGSSDRTYDTLVAHSVPDLPGFHVVGLQLSRNFGQQAAIQAGLEVAFSRASRTSFFVVMDSDLQHPPKLLVEILEKLADGFDHVQMLRREPPSLSLWKRATSNAFYWVLRRLSDVQINNGGSDFRGLSFDCLAAYLQLRERGRFNRGLFHWVGFKRCEIVYQADERRFGGTKYSLAKMLSLGLLGILQFSSRPLLWMCSTTVALSIAICGAYLCFEALRYARGVEFAIGWPSVIFFISFWSGAIALNQLIMSIYIARLFDEMKSRPVYIVRRSTLSTHESPTEP